MGDMEQPNAMNFQKRETRGEDKTKDIEMELNKLDSGPGPLNVEIIGVVEHVLIGLGNLLPNTRFFTRLRGLVLRLAGVDLGTSAAVWGKLEISPPGACPRVHIGHHVFINSGARFAAPKGSCVTIRDYAMIGPRCSFETINHELVPNHNNIRLGKSAPIVVEKFAWIGANSVILPGVTVGKYSVVAAGSVVNRDVPPHTLVGGVPAKFIKQLERKT